MIQLSEQQLAALQRLEQQEFVQRVHDDLIARFPDLAGQPGLRQRLEVAHDAALQLGIEDAGMRTQFLHQEAWAPGFYEQPAIRSWLSRPGMSGEQRWKDFMALMGHRLGLSEEEGS